MLQYELQSADLTPIDIKTLCFDQIQCNITLCFIQERVSMKRDIEQELFTWKNQTERMPLLVRGARQVGKTYLVENFGKKAFQNVVTINFEFQPEIKKCFDTFDPNSIINKLQLVLGVEIHEDKTLLFLDEIQEFPEAITALRYFKERKPRLAVIGAGSLLEFALQAKDFKMPVGRVQFLYLQPLSFGEFLTALGHNALRRHLESVDLNSGIEESVHEQLLKFVHYYCVVGGMPAIVNVYRENQDFMICQRRQNALLQSFRSDFGKYSQMAEQRYLHKVFDRAPLLVGSRFKYVQIDPDSKSRDLKNALRLLVLAGIIQPVYATAASGPPLAAQQDEQKFKVTFLDIGLMQNACGLQAKVMLEKNLLRINAGALAEQFSGQEINAYDDHYREPRLFFWARDQKSSMAEVDYVIELDGQVLPVEVKAGKTGRLKSLKLFLKEKKTPLGIRVSQENLSFYDQILSVPLYLMEQIPRLVRMARHLGA